MTINTELLQRTITQVVDHPEDHNQSLVATDCGTPGCFLGWALYFHYGSDWQTERTGNSCVEATEILGISYEDAWAIFDPENTVDALQLMVKDILNDGHMAGDENYYANLLEENA